MAAADQATANSGDTERLSPELHALPRRKPWELRSLPLRHRFPNIAVCGYANAADRRTWPLSGSMGGRRYHTSVGNRFGPRYSVRMRKSLKDNAEHAGMSISTV